MKMNCAFSVASIELLETVLYKNFHYYCYLLPVFKMARAFEISSIAVSGDVMPYISVAIKANH